MQLLFYNKGKKQLKATKKKSPCGVHLPIAARQCDDSNGDAISAQPSPKLFSSRHQLGGDQQSALVSLPVGKHSPLEALYGHWPTWNSYGKGEAIVSFVA